MTSDSRMCDITYPRNTALTRPVLCAQSPAAQASDDDDKFGEPSIWPCTVSCVFDTRHLGGSLEGARHAGPVPCS